MKKELFKLLVAEFEKLGINPTKWLGTRTNVKRIGERNLSATPINEFAIKTEFEEKGVERILKLFEEEGRYLAQLNDMEATQLLANLKVANKKAADEAKLDSAILKASMDVSDVDRKLAERLNLDMSKIADYEKLQVWKDKHGVPDWTKESESGIGSLFKTREQNELKDLGSQLDAIAKEGKSLADEAKKLVDMAWKMSPEGMAAEEAIRKNILKREHEGKGFVGGVFGHRNDGFFRAIVRPFLLDQHDKGIIKIADNTLESLKNADDLKGGGDFMSADPVRVFRQHYGDDAFDLIPDLEAFGGGQYGPTSKEKIAVLEKVIGKPILKVGPDNPGGYLTKGEYQAKLDHQDEVLGYIERKEGRFGDMSEKEIAQEIADTKRVKDTLKVAMDIDYPPTGTTTDLTPEVSGIDDTLKSDFEGAVTTKGFTDPFPGSKATTPMKPTKLSLNIRLMKNFDQPLDDAGLAKEGYNVQEIDVLKKARNRMTTGEEPHPNEALLREKELLADEAGVDLDELKLDIDWGDMTPEPFASGGGVGSLFRKTDRARYSTAGEVGKYAGKKIKDILDDLMKHKKIRDLVEKTNKKLNESGITKMWKEDRKLDKDSKIVAEKVLAPFVETVDKMTPWKVSDKSSRNATLAWFREELANPEMRKVYHPNWEKGTMVYRGEKTAKNMEYSKKHDSSMFTTGHHPGYTYKPEHVGGFASTSPDQAIRYAVEAEGFPRVTKARLEPTDFQEAAERNVLENPYGVTSDVLLNEEQKAALKTDLLSTGIATVKKYWPFSKGGSVSRQRLFEKGITSMFRRV